MDDDHQKIGSLALSLRQMRHAVAAADHGGVTRAARALNISQPAISAAIAALEDHYKTPLFVRSHGQGVRLTSFGQALFADIRALLKQAEAVAALGAAGGTPRGMVTLAIYEALAPYYLPAILTALERELPEVSVRFAESRLDSLVARLQDGSADFGITYDLALGGGVASTTLYELQPFILTAADHRFARRRAVHLRELARERLVLLDQEASAAYVLGLLNAQGITPAAQMRASSFELQRSLVANGHGVAISHTRPAVNMSYDGKALRHIAVADRIAPQRVLLAHASRHRLQPAAAAAREVIARLFATLAPAAHATFKPSSSHVLIGRKKRA